MEKTQNQMKFKLNCYFLTYSPSSVGFSFCRRSLFLCIVSLFPVVLGYFVASFNVPVLALFLVVFRYFFAYFLGPPLPLLLVAISYFSASFLGPFLSLFLVVLCYFFASFLGALLVLFPLVSFSLFFASSLPFLSGPFLLSFSLFLGTFSPVSGLSRTLSRCSSLIPYLLKIEFTVLLFVDIIKNLNTLMSFLKFKIQTSS